MSKKNLTKTLVENVRKYNKNVDGNFIEKACNFAQSAHEGQRRQDGQPYFSHCLAVSHILAEKHMDTATIVAALLHDTLEDTPTTAQDLQRVFGKEITSLVKGVTKLKACKFRSAHTTQAENFRKLLLAISEDIRSLLIKLADRLHNIRTLQHLKSQKKILRIAKETMDIYAPLAERIGIRDWKEELEDICFSYINPDAKASIVARLNRLNQACNAEVIDQVIFELEDLCKKIGIRAIVEGRRKTPYSIWRKIQKKDVGFEQLSDIVAFRIIVDKIEDCYATLGLIHAKYRLIPGKFKDYISLPKANGYRSLHTSVIGPASQRVEIQVRDQEMHTFAEVGVAAHWNYKSEYKEKNALKEGKNYHWIRELLAILETTSNADDFLETTKMEMYADKVFVFSPKGDLINLPKGSCAIDFAYSIHSKIGDGTVGARINGRITPLRTQLKHGDQVEILTAKNAEPNPDWESFVASGKAKSAIRRYRSDKKHVEYITKGKSALKKTFKDSGHALTEANIKTLTTRFGYGNCEAYLASLGEGGQSTQEGLQSIYPNVAIKNKERSQKFPPSLPLKKTAIDGIPKDTPALFPKCCHPVPGDTIVGIIQTGKGISIHAFECKELKQYESFSDRWISLCWNDDHKCSKAVFTAHIKVILNNKHGVICDLTTIISKNNSNITDLKFIDRDKDFYELMIELEVSNVAKLIHIIGILRTHKIIVSVSRA